MTKLYVRAGSIRAGSSSVSADVSINRSAAGSATAGRAVARRPHRRGQGGRIALVSVILLAALALVIFPVWYVVVAAFDRVNALGAQNLWPNQPSLHNFQVLWNEDSGFLFKHWFINSLIVSVVVSAATVVFTTMAAFSFSRYRFRGRKPLMQAIVLIQVFPNLLALVAIYLIITQVGNVVSGLGLNSRGALILVYLGGILGGNVWLMKGYLDSIPRDLDESATLDGASQLEIFWRILLPLSRPMLAVIAVLAFVGAYGEFLLASILIPNVGSRTLPAGMQAFVAGGGSTGGDYSARFGAFAAGALIASIPPLILFYSLQGWLVRGLTQGAIKN